jgi:glycosyltransferase involved in cell wall biosynthesis
MKITFVLPGFSATPIGGFKIIYEYSNQLARRGHQVTVVHSLQWVTPPTSVAPSLYRQLRGELRALKCLSEPELKWHPIDRRVRMRLVPRLTPRHAPDGEAVFATAWQTAEYVVQYPPSKGQKLYMVMDFDPWLGPKDRLERTWRWPFKKVTISSWLYNKVRGAAGASTDVINIPIGVDHQKFRLKRPISIRPKRAAMLYGLSSYKVPQDGLRALEIVKARHPDVEAAIFGPGSVRPQDVPPWASYSGNIPEAELVDIYNSSRIYLCCSIAEGFAFPPAEAMACGCAVVSTDCGGVREYAEHGVTAILSPPRDTKALAENIVRLLDDDALRQRLAQAGHERIREFTWEHSTERLADFISRCVQDKGSP